MRKAIAAALLTAAVALPGVASAYTHCTAKVTRIWAGDSGHVFVEYLTSDNVSGAYVMTPTNANREAVLSLSITALTTLRTVTARYPDGASCAGNHFDVEGIYLNP